MYEELISRLRADEFPISEIHIWMREAADVIEKFAEEREELLWCINYMATCDNCKYFGGCCCDHVDEDGNCLGWELQRKPTEEEQKAYDEYMAEAVRIAKQVLEERKS